MVAEVGSSLVSPSLAGQGKAKLPGPQSRGEPVRMEVPSVSWVESLCKSCVNRGRITKKEPLQL